MLGPLELAIIVAAFILFFGYRRLPNLGKALGQSIEEFRHAEERNDD